MLKSGLLTLLLTWAATDRQPLSLEEAIDSALQHNERAAIADADMDIAAAEVDQAESRFLPRLNGVGRYNRRMREITALNPNGGAPVVLQQQDSLGAAGEVRLDILDARAIPLYRGALRAREAMVYSAAENKRLLAFDTAKQFFQVLEHEQVRDAAARQMSFAEQTLKDTRARYDAQLVGNNDVTRAELQLAVAMRDLTDAQGNVEIAYQELSFLVAQPVTPPLANPNALMEQAVTSVAADDTLVPAATERRLDLRSLGKQVEAARQRALEPHLRIIPTLTLGGDINITNEPGYGGHAVNGYISLVLNWSLYDGGLRYAEAHALDAKVRRLELDTHQRTRAVAKEVNTAHINLRKMQTSSKQAAAAADAANRNTQENQALYRKGLANALSVEDAITRSFSTNVTLARQQFELALAYLHLRAAVGLDPLGREPRAIDGAGATRSTDGAGATRSTDGAGATCSTDGAGATRLTDGAGAPDPKEASDG